MPSGTGTGTSRCHGVASLLRLHGHFSFRACPWATLHPVRRLLQQMHLRVGYCVAEPDSSGAVACMGPLGAYQCAGATGSAHGTAVFSSIPGRHVLVWSDNVSTISHINHQGGTRSARLLQVSRGLLLWAAPCLASTRVMYLPGERYKAADYLSHCKPPPGEWRFNQRWCSTSVTSLAEVDLIATEELTHCPLWFSLTEEAILLGQDALVHNWPEVLLYSFPPIPLIDLILQRVLQQGHTLLLISPFYLGKAWFPLLHRLCRSSLWHLPDRMDLLSQ